MANFGNPRIDFLPRQLAAFSGLGTLSHLDLNLFGVGQVVAGHAETARGYLFDGTHAPVAVVILDESALVLAAFAAVALAANAVHRDRERLMRFTADRAIAHGTSLETLDDLSPRLDFI